MSGTDRRLRARVAGGTVVAVLVLGPALAGCRSTEGVTSPPGASVTPAAAIPQDDLDELSAVLEEAGAAAGAAEDELAEDRED
ncbi:MAG: hypothetical protein GXX79_18780 [Actinomycetales bacterium]|nr:hypothetical protein [Actinomycetales bacterium]